MTGIRIVKKSKLYVGIDASSKVLASVTLDTDGALVDVRNVKLSKGSESYTPSVSGRGYGEVTRLLRELSEVDGRVRFCIAIEQPVVYGAGRGRSTFVQSFVSGAFQAAAANYGSSSVSFVPPAQWKKSILGKGNLDKEGVASAVQQRWPSDFDHLRSSQDLIDAYCIARYACEHLP